MSVPGASLDGSDRIGAEGGTSYRLFIALDIDQAAKDHVHRVQQALHRLLGTCAVTWEPPDNFHVSLRFLGDTPRRRVGKVLDMMGGVAAAHWPVELRTSGLGVFHQSDRPRVPHLQVGPRTVRFLALQAVLESAVQSLGSWPPAEFPFTPHVTIGRVSRGLNPKAFTTLGHTLHTVALDARIGPSWRVDRIGLYVSELGNDGVVYRCLGEATLGRW